MIQNQTFEGFPIFGDNSSMSQPEAAIYANGFAPADVLPAEYYNWLTYKASKGITDLNKGVVSMEAELNNVVSAGGQEPNENTNNQIITAIRYLINQARAEAILAAHPIGSLYWSSKDTNPSTLFGGTWKRIKDRFVYAMGDNDTVDVTGGNATITLTTHNLPSHEHTGPSHAHTYTPSGTVSAHAHGLNNHTHSFTPSGSVSAHAHGLNNHTHSFSGSESHTHGVMARKFGLNTSNDCFPISSAKYEYGFGTPGVQSIGSEGYSYIIKGAHSGIQLLESSTVSISGTTGGSSANTANATPTFTGTEGSTGGSTANTANATPTFTGTQGITNFSGTGYTGSTGGGAAFNIYPPFINKYCWERIA